MIRTKYVEKKKQIKNKKQTKEKVCMLHVCAGRMHMLVQQLCMCDWKEEITLKKVDMWSKRAVANNSCWAK